MDSKPGRVECPGFWSFESMEEEKDWIGRRGFGAALEEWGDTGIIGRAIYFRGQAAVIDIFKRESLRVGIKPVGRDTTLPLPIGVDPESHYDREFDPDPDRTTYREIVFADVDSPEICWRRTRRALYEAAV